MIRFVTTIFFAGVLALAIACGESEESPAKSASATASPAVLTVSSVPSPAPSSTASSGVQGQVLAGPQCPVVREGSPCPDRPIRATIDVRTPDSDELVTTFSSSDDGRFRVALPPGDYVIVPRPAPSFALSAGAPQTVAVRDGQWTEVTIEYDTGIR